MTHVSGIPVPMGLPNRATSSSVGVPPATALVWFKASSASRNLGSGMEAWYHPIENL